MPTKVVTPILFPFAAGSVLRGYFFSLKKLSCEHLKTSDSFVNSIVSSVKWSSWEI